MAKEEGKHTKHKNKIVKDKWGIESEICKLGYGG